MKRVWLIGIAAAIGLVAAGVYGFVLNSGFKPGPVTLTFVAEVDGEPLVFDEFVYTNPGGDEAFRIRDFRVYISNIVLSDGEKSHVVEDSYHLLRFDRNTLTFGVTLPDVPLRRLTGVTMSIGVDEEANGSIKTRGDLDPNNRMAWNWRTGYKFVLAEGAIRVGGEVQPLVYHIGFSENRRNMVFTPPAPVLLIDDDELSFSVDVMKLFRGERVIDMAALPTVKMDKTDASRLAANYASMIEPRWRTNANDTVIVDRH
jgi:hypothetical protein